jgi:hypothetical protein
MCVADRPSAGGKAPLWHVEHCPAIEPCVPCVCANLLGFQEVPVGAWQLKQLAVVGMCALGLPVAVPPLWHVLQLVAADMDAWSTLPAQLAVVWHVSQFVTPLWMGVFGLPAAGGNPPVWQVTHWPVTVTLLWSLAGAQAVNPPLWQVSQFTFPTPDTFW